MKLSEAIRMNGMMKPQGFGPDSIISTDAPCALGGALQSVGSHPRSQMDALWAVADKWPWSIAQYNTCPVCDSLFYQRPIRAIIWHLNDDHEWTRQQIADWVETVEPQEVAEVVPVVEEVLTHQ
jgi:hypothetical protein